MLRKFRSFLLENKTLKQTVLKNVFWLSFGQFLGRFIRAFLVIYIARVLGSEGYGIFSYALSLAAFFTIFSDVGVSSILTREAARFPEKAQSYFSTAFVLKLVLVTISALLIMFLGPLATNIPEAAALFPIVAILLAFDGFREFTFAISRARERMQVEAFVTIFTNIAIVAAGLAAIFVLPTPLTLTIGYAVGSGLGFFFATWLVRTYFRHPIRFFSLSIAKGILREAWPFALMGFLGGIMINTDTIMLGWLRDASEVGFYSAAQRPVQLLYLFVGILAASLFPVFARLAHENIAQMRLILEKALKLTLMAALPILVGGVILAAPIVLLLFGAEYAPSISSFSLLLITVLVVYPGTLIGNAVFALNKQKNFVGFLALGALGNVLLNFVLIPPLGAMGSAIATVGAQFIANGFMWWRLQRILRFQILNKLSKVAVATAAMGGLTYFLAHIGVNLFVNLGVSIAIYFAVLNILGEKILAQVREAINV